MKPSRHWTDGLSTRAAIILCNRFNSKKEVLAAFAEKKLHPKFGLWLRNYGWQTHAEVTKWLGLKVEIPTGNSKLYQARLDRDLLRGALLAIVACPDYRNIQTHEMERARKALEKTQP